MGIVAVQTDYNFNRKDSISCDFKTRELDQCNFIFFSVAIRNANYFGFLKLFKEIQFWF